MKECVFETLRNGRIRCKTHRQDLIYLFWNGKKMCQVGEDESITEMGFVNYLKWINTINCAVCGEIVKVGKWVNPRQIVCNPCIKKMRKVDRAFWKEQKKLRSDAPRAEADLQRKGGASIEREG